MARVFVIDASTGYDSNEFETETTALSVTVITYLMHDSQLDQMFTISDNIAIEVSSYNDYPNTQVIWYPISSFWLNVLNFLSFSSKNYFIMSKEQHNKMRDEALETNTLSFRLGKKSSDGSIVSYLVRGTYDDFEGGGGGGLLHGAKVPSP